MPPWITAIDNVLCESTGIFTNLGIAIARMTITDAVINVEILGVRISTAIATALATTTNVTNGTPAKVDHTAKGPSAWLNVILAHG